MRSGFLLLAWGAALTFPAGCRASGDAPQAEALTFDQVRAMDPIEAANLFRDRLKDKSRRFDFCRAPGLESESRLTFHQTHYGIWVGTLLQKDSKRGGDYGVLHDPHPARRIDALLITMEAIAAIRWEDVETSYGLSNDLTPFFALANAASQLCAVVKEGKAQSPTGLWARIEPGMLALDGEVSAYMLKADIKKENEAELARRRERYAPAMRRIQSTLNALRKAVSAS